MSILCYLGFSRCLMAVTPRSVSGSWHFLGLRRVAGLEGALARAGWALFRAGLSVGGLPCACQLMTAGEKAGLGESPARSAQRRLWPGRGRRSGSGPFFELELIAQRDPVVAHYGDLRL